MNVITGVQGALEEIEQYILIGLLKISKKCILLCKVSYLKKKCKKELEL